jgi:hypothetical protein
MTNSHTRIKELYKQSVARDLLKTATEEEDLERELTGKPPISKVPKLPEKKQVSEKTTLEDLEKELLGNLPTPEKTIVPVKKEKPFVMPSTKKPEGPQTSFQFEPKKYTPQEALAKECPLCHFKNRPILLTECKKCKNLYGRMKRKEDRYDVSPQQAIQTLSAETSYGYSVLKKIYDNQGLTPITIADIQPVDPSLNKQVEDMLWYRFNVQKDENKQPKTDKSGLPVPLAKPIYYTSKQLGLGLRLTPELFTQKIDEYNAGKKEKDWIKPAYSADVISDVPGRRYKATYLSIWNWAQVKPVFAEWIKELEEKIIPEEKVERAKGSIQRITEALESSKSQQETIEEELKILAKDAPNKKFLRLLRAFRQASPEEIDSLKKKYKVTREMLEKKYGKELDYFVKLVEHRQTILGKISKKRSELQKRLEQRKSWLFKLLEQQGYKFNIDTEIAEKEKDDELKELEAELGGTTSEEQEEVSELEKELTSRLNVLHSLLRFSAVPFGPKQLGLFGDEPEEEEGKFLEPKVKELFQKPFEPVQGPRQEPEEKPIIPELKPEIIKPKKIIHDPFGTTKGRYKIYFISFDPATKEKKNLNGVFEYTPGARSKNVEEALKKRVTDKFNTLLVETHGLTPGSYVKAIVSDPALNTNTYSFNIDKDGKMVWHGTKVEDRRRKQKLLEYQPDLKLQWVNGLIKIDDLVEVDGKLIEKERLEKGYISPEEEKPKAKQIERSEIIKRVPKPKRIDILRKKKELGIISEDEISELNELEIAQKDQERIEELSAKKDLTSEEKLELENLKNLYEDTEFSPSEKPIPEATELSSKEFTRKCPYPGCGAKVPDNAEMCWKCKSPIAKNELRKVVVRRVAKRELITKQVRDPITNQITMEPEEKVTVFPIHSLVTLTTDDDGKPVSARCEKLSVSYKETGGTKKVPAFPKIMKEIQSAIDKINKDPKYTAEQKEKAKSKINEIYQRKVTEQSGESPWKTIKPKTLQAGLPRDICEDCPGEIKAPFEGACGDINAVLKSLDPNEKVPYGYTILDYEKARHIAEAPEKTHRPWTTDKMPDAKDGKFARFDSIMKLYLD